MHQGKEIERMRMEPFSNTIRQQRQRLSLWAKCPLRRSIILICFFPWVTVPVWSLCTNERGLGIWDQPPSTSLSIYVKEYLSELNLLCLVLKSFSLTTLISKLFVESHTCICPSDILDNNIYIRIFVPQPLTQNSSFLVFTSETAEKRKHF